MGKRRALPSREVLQRLIDYEPQTGRLLWKARNPEECGPAERDHRAALAFNKRFAGTVISVSGTNKEKRGGDVHILGSHYAINRVIWKMVYEYDPDVLTPKDGDYCNYRIDNWIASDWSIRTRSKSLSNKNTSGVRGVSLNVKTGRYLAAMTVNGKRLYLGTYATVAEAAAARAIAERKHGFKDWPTDGRHTLSPT